MRHDRTYYRACSTRRLIEDAMGSDNELTIALGERLGEFEYQEDIVDDLLKENRELETRVDDLRREIESLNRALGVE